MRTILAFGLLLALPAAAAGYDIDQLAKDVRAHHQAMMKKMGDLAIEQEATFSAPGGEKSSVASKMFYKGDRWRTEGSIAMAAQGGQEGMDLDGIQVFDGQDLWSVAMGMKMKMPHGQAGGGAQSFGMAPAPGSRIVGEEKVGGRDCWIVQGPAMSDNPMMKSASNRTWVDKKSFVWVQAVTEMNGNKTRAVFSDFRKVEGFEIPHLTEMYSGDKVTMTARIVKIATKQGLSDDLFDPAKLPGTEMSHPMMGGRMGAEAMPAEIDMDAILKQAEEMKKRMEEMQAPDGK